MVLCLCILKILFKYNWCHNPAAVTFIFCLVIQTSKTWSVTPEESNSERKLSFYFYFNTVLKNNFLVCFLIRHSQRSRIRELASSLNSWVPSWVCVMTSLISFLLMCLFSVSETHCLELEFLCKQYCFRCFTYPAVDSTVLIYELTCFIQVCFMMICNGF